MDDVNNYREGYNFKKLNLFLKEIKNSYYYKILA